MKIFKLKNTFSLLIFGVVILALFLTGPKLIFAQLDQAIEEWAVRYNGPANSYDVARAIATDSKGNVYVAGASRGLSNYANDYYDYATVKYDTNGNQLWAARYNGPGNESDESSAIIVDINDNIYITGRSGDGLGVNRYDYATVKYDTNGNQLWAARYNGPDNISDFSVDIATDNNSNVYVTGSSGSLNNSFDYLTIKYDKNGNQAWTARYNGGIGNYNDFDSAYSLVVDNIGNVFVTGMSRSPNNYTGYDYATIKYDTNGNQLWIARYDEGLNFDDRARSITLDNVGNVYITGESGLSDSYNTNFVTVSYDNNGNQRWISFYDGPGRVWSNVRFSKDRPVTAITDSNNNLYVAGTSEGDISYDDYVIIKYDNNGNQLWVARYDGPGRFIDTLKAIVLDKYNNVYITGESRDWNSTGSTETANSDYATVKYDTDGNQIWEARYLGSGWGYDSATDIVIDDNNDIYVTGYSYGPYFSLNDYVTIKYKQIKSLPQQFWSEVRSNLNGLRLRATPGVIGKPESDVLKTLPNKWVLKVLSTKDTNGNNVDIDNFRWYQVQDVTDGTTGWVAAESLSDGTKYLEYNASAQADLRNKAQNLLDTKEKRIPPLFEAVDRYYSNTDTSNSLYGTGGGRDGLNNFQKFISGANFPKEVILSIATQESGPEFNNEICSFAKDGGIGIMQITSLSFKGLGSGLDNILRKNDCNAKTGWIGNLSKYYSNTIQGIYANIKDGFRVLQDKYRQKCPKNSIVIQGYTFTCQDIEKILTVWGYNGFAVDKNTGLYTGNYLKYIADKLRNLSFYFSGIIYSNTDNLIEKLEVANNNKQIIRLYSPATFHIIDSLGRTTGLINDLVFEEIPNSLYERDAEGAAIFFPDTSYRYRVVGTIAGSYSFSVDFTDNGVLKTFNAFSIPITGGEIHEYIIDWDALDRNERGVTVNIDYSGDGIIDQVIISDKELTDIEPPQIIVPALQSEYLFNSQLGIQFGATDNVSGLAGVNATLNGAVISSGQTVILNKPGVNTFQITATDNDGNITISTQTFRVIYNFLGFLPPIKIDGSGIYNKGRTLPVKFQLTNVNGNFISIAIASLYIAKISDGIAGTDEIPLSTSAADTGNLFRCDIVNNQYIYNLSTDILTPGTWQIKVILDSGQVYTVIISLK